MIAIKTTEGSNILSVTVSGKLAKQDYEVLTSDVESLIRQHGKIRVLMEMENFHGWTMGALWEDTKFALEHFADIERLALVGDKEWEKGMASFCKPFTTAEIRYFDRPHANMARQWIAA